MIIILGGILFLVIVVYCYLKVCCFFIGKWLFMVKRLVVLGIVVVVVVLFILMIFFYGEIKVISDWYSVENIFLVGYWCGNKGFVGVFFGYNVFLFIYVVMGIVIIIICYIFIGRFIYSKVMIYRKFLRCVNVVFWFEFLVFIVFDIRWSKNFENCVINDKNGDYGY